MKKLTSNSIVLRNPNILHSTIDNEVVMMSISQSKFYGINDIGSEIWNLLENEMSIDELVKKLIQLYDVDKETCTMDVLSFFMEAMKHNLIEVK